MTIQATIESKLKTQMIPSHLEVLNESHTHNVPPGSESHFKVTLVSQLFEGISRIKRHQQIYQLLADEMKLIHALSLHTYTPEEWQQREGAPDSPRCRGGSKH